MISRLNIILLSIVCVCESAGAVTSPYLTLHDFAFTRPLFTNLIKGVVMGDTNSYSTVRYEDIAFLEEAIAERELSTAQMSHESFTNMVSATNATLTSVTITAPRSFLIETMLDPELVLSDKPRVVYSTANGIDNTTNKIVKGRLSLSTNQYHHIALITQRMKSGEVDVWTNRFSEAFTSNVYDRMVFITNYVSGFEHYCTTNVLMYIDENLDVQSNILSKLSTRWYSQAGIRKRFELMRLSNRPAPIQSNTDLANIISDSIVKANDDDPVHRTTTNHVYHVSVGSNRSYFRQQINTDEGWVDDGDPSESSSWYNYSDIPDLSQVVVNTGLPHAILSYKFGPSKRLDYVDVYSSAEIEYHKFAVSRHSTPGGSATDTDIETNYSAKVIFPCGRYENFESTTNNMMTVEIDMSIPYQEICRLTGIDYLDQNSRAVLPSVGNPEWRGGDERRIKETYQNSSATLDIEPSKTLYLFFHLTPKSTLPGWNNP